MKKPNIVIFNPDQYRADALSHLGKVKGISENMDSLVENDAVSFSNAFCQNPVCTPSRCSFMSGWYPHVRGHRTMFHMMHEDEPVLLKTLKDKGYFVWWGGKNDLTPAQNSIEPYCNLKYKTNPTKKNLHGDQTWRGKRGESDYYSFYAGKLDKGAEEIYHDEDWDIILGAKDFIKNYDNENPMCMYLPLAYPHPPYGVEDPYYSDVKIEDVPPRIKTSDFSKKPSILKGIYENQNMQNYSEDNWQELRRTYFAMCKRVDDQLGILIQALKNKGIYDDTAIFIFSDHGDFTGDYGLVEKTQNTFEDVLVKVPLIIKPPKYIDIKPGICDGLVELIDFPATVEDMLDIEPEHTHFGKSLLSLISGEETEHRDAVFCEGGRLKGEKHCMELEMAENTVDTGLYWPRVSLQNKEGDEHTKAVMCRTKDYKYVKRLYEKDELYDMTSDSQELINQIDNKKYAHILLNLKERLCDFYLETSDIVPHKTDKRF